MLFRILVLFYLSFLLTYVYAESQEEIEVEASKSQAWGPGLLPTKLVFPARYFFVKLCDKFGNE